MTNADLRESIVNVLEKMKGKAVDKRNGKIL